MRDEDRHALLDQWVRADANRVLAYLLHRTDPQTAQDVLQEVFVTAFRKAEAVPRRPTGWLFGTARRLLANKHRGNRRSDELIATLLDDARREVDAEALGTSAATYAVRPRRARTRLAAVLDEAGYRGETPAGLFAEALRG